MKHFERMNWKASSAFLCAAAMIVAAGIAQASPGSPADPAGAIGNSAPIRAHVNCARVNVCSNVPVLNGEAFAGGGLIWRTNFSANTLELVDTNNGCNVLQRCLAPGASSPASSPSELTLLNGILYHYDFGTGLLYGIDPVSCQVVSICDPPGDDLAEGLTNDGTFLWKGDSQNLYKFTPPSVTGGGCQVVQVCPNPAGDSADGLTFCGDNLVMLGYSGNLYEISPVTCAVIGLCPLNAGPSGNGITGDRNAVLYVDDNVSLNLDRVDTGCDIPVPAETSTWSGVKIRYR